MTQVSVVIGAGYGDEGKGQTVHNLSTRNTCVVRFNGGAQAGHTSVHHGSRNVFHQFGAGAFVGAATYAGPEVILSPTVYITERAKFPAHTFIVDARCRVTTYTDMVINQIIETHRGSMRHGSCGMGIRETMTRHAEFPLTVDMIGHADFRDRVNHIWHDVGPSRLISHGYGHLMPEYFEALPNQYVIEQSINEMVRMYQESVKIESAWELRGLFDNYVFEGAQGLLLSERNIHWMPHLTPSDTGITNAFSVLGEMNIDDIDVCDIIYVTRPYLTRHGAGPLLYEWGTAPPFDVIDDTNVPNDWQGTIRYAPLNIDLLQQYVNQDFARAQLTTVTQNILVTCMSHIDDTVRVIINGSIKCITGRELYHVLCTVFPQSKINVRY